MSTANAKNSYAIGLSLLALVMFILWLLPSRVSQPDYKDIQIDYVTWQRKYPDGIAVTYKITNTSPSPIDITMIEIE